MSKSMVNLDLLCWTTCYSAFKGVYTATLTQD